MQLFNSNHESDMGDNGRRDYGPSLGYGDVPSLKKKKQSKPAVVPYRRPQWVKDMMDGKQLLNPGYRRPAPCPREQP